MLVVVAVRDGASGGDARDAAGGRWRDVLRGEERSFGARERLASLVGEHGFAVFERLSGVSSELPRAPPGRDRRARARAGASSGCAPELGLGEPYADPGVEYFGLRNAVFALGDTFLEVDLAAATRAPPPAASSIAASGDCGYMVMAQLDDLAAARDARRALGIREVFEVALDDIAEVHLHPADIGGAIVSLSEPRPPASWRWAGPDWEQRSAPLRDRGGDARRERRARGRRALAGGDRRALPGVRFARGRGESGAGRDPHRRRRRGRETDIDLGGVRLDGRSVGCPRLGCAFC